MERMSCIWSALETCYRWISFRKNVNDFSFSFVSPLKSEYYIKFHMFCVFNFSLEWKIITRILTYEICLGCSLRRWCLLLNRLRISRL